MKEIGGWTGSMRHLSPDTRGRGLVQCLVQGLVQGSQAKGLLRTTAKMLGMRFQRARCTILHRSPYFLLSRTTANRGSSFCPRPLRPQYRR